jgi:EmrB/QacA subfamily drug resistance transporter
MTQLETRPPPTADPRRWRALYALALVQFIIVIDTTIVNVALPSIQRDLRFSTSGLAWVINGYLLTAGGLLLLGGRVGDIVGRRRMFLAGTALFAVASFVCGAAQNAGMLVAGRFAQGAGEALASPAALSLIALLFLDGRERNKALGIWGGLAGVGATVGVLLSGVLTEWANWRWVFFINLPFAAVALLLVPRLVDESRAARRGGRADVLGAVLVTGGLTGVVHGLLAASRNAWGDVAVVAPLVAGIGCLLAFVAVETRVGDPLVPLRFFANRTRVSANVCAVFMTGGMIAMFLLLTLFMQDVLGYSAIRTGVAYLPLCAAFVVGVVGYTVLAGRLGIKATLVLALAIGAAGMLLMGAVPADGAYLTRLMPAMVVVAIGLGMGLPALQNAGLHEVSEQDAGLGSGVQTALQALGGALGVAVLVTVALRRTAAELAAGVPAAQAMTAGYQLAYRVGAGALIVGAVITLALMRRIPAPRSTPEPATPEPVTPDPATPARGAATGERTCR